MVQRLSCKPFTAARVVRAGPPKFLASRVQCRDSASEAVLETQCLDTPDRRHVLASSLLLFALQSSQLAPAALADDTSTGARQAFLEFAVDGKTQGKIVVQLYDDVAVGSSRFADLAVGKQGVGYRRSRIDGIFKGEYIRCAGVASLSYSNEDSPIAGGDSTADLERELAQSSRKHDAAGLVSLQVKLPEGSLVTSTKLVASRGKLVEVTETSGIVPNGTGFAVTLGRAPALDATNLIVGRVVEGMDVLEQLAELPIVKDNSNSPFFAAGKAIGDKRATVAELGFNRPFSRVIVSKSGLM